jgi:signal transduction histidine kinase
VSAPAAHILFVEDNEATRYAVNRILRNAGYAVTTADGGQKGIDLARAVKPDLVLLDVRLPDMMGFDVCRSLKAAPETASIPIVFLSASHVASADKVQGLEGGADAYLTHPVEPHVLVATLQALLRVRLAERDRTEALARAEDAQRRMSLLLDVTSALISEPARLGETLNAVAHLVVPALADWCVADRVEADGALARAAVAALPERAKAAAVVASHPPVGGEGAAGRALARGETQLVDDVAEEGVEPPRDAAHAAALDALGASAVMAVPLAVRGRMLGALTFVRSGGGRFSPGDLALAEEIAARVALALENARLYEELGAHLRAREDALAEVAHDLRTPLQAIVLGALAIERGGDPTLVRRTADGIRRAGERMSRLVSDMLDLARIQAGRLPLQPAPHDAAGLVTDAVEAHVPIAREKDLQLEPRAVPGLEVSCDRERVEQVLANLIGNAVKYSPPGGRVEAGAVARGGDAVFWVRDEGPGIALEDQAHVFERYWRARRAGSGGAGLGLSIAKGIVEGHGGRIWVTSTPGAGATFFFSLPLPPRG